MTAELHSLVGAGGTLRAAINTGNRALVQVNDGRLCGLSPDIARALAAALDVPLQAVVYDSAGKVVADSGAGVWDVAFLAVDPARSDVVAFTAPYVTIETTYAVRAGSEFRSAEDLDRPGLEILVSRGAAYDLHLTKALRHATLIRADTPDISMDRFRDGEADAVAGVRESLVARLGAAPDIRILPDALLRVRQAMAVPLARAGVIPALERFLDRARADGLTGSGVSLEKPR